MSSKIVRVYPIRTTRRKWKIPIFCYHKCEEYCSIKITRDINNLNQIMFIENTDYKDGKCSYSEKLERTVIKLNDFNINNPRGYRGPLYNPDMKVIPDTSFTLTLYYPLSHSLEINIHAPTSNGFTLIELLYSIKLLYVFIYEEEENTAVPQNYRIEKKCSNCDNKDISSYITDVGDTESTDDSKCCICYGEYKNNAGKLECKHIFHKQCIHRWLNTSLSCPLCRQTVYACNECSGKGTIYYYFTGTVIPVSERGLVPTRNRTYGLFGIHSYDLEDLVIEDMEYDRGDNRLKIRVSA
jgi:hypothetical protein